MSPLLDSISDNFSSELLFNSSKECSVDNLEDQIQVTGREVIMETKAKVSDYDIKTFGAKDFNLISVIGEGAYGKVLKVEEKSSGKLFAMKIISKKKVIRKNDSSYVISERNILTTVCHPFIIRLLSSFQTPKKLYLVMDLIPNGELFDKLTSEGLFHEPVASFYAAEIALALKYLHELNIVHRDLKPENVLLDESGHVRLTDFGLAKDFRGLAEGRTKTICGTDLYMAPEMLAGKGYNKAVDWWSLGALTFEMMSGDPPFYAKDTKKLYSMIMTKSPRIPTFLTQTAGSFLRGLLNRNVTKRLGNVPSTMFKIGGVQELLDHKFFNHIDFNAILEKKNDGPFCNKPELKFENNDKFVKEESKELEVFSQVTDVESTNTDEFAGFTYVNKTFLQALLSNAKPDAGLATVTDGKMIDDISIQVSKIDISN